MVNREQWIVIIFFRSDVADWSIALNTLTNSLVLKSKPDLRLPHLDRIIVDDWKTIDIAAGGVGVSYSATVTNQSVTRRM